MATRPPDLYSALLAHIQAQQQIKHPALEAQRLHDAGDLDGARAALAEAERHRSVLEQIEAAYRG